MLPCLAVGCYSTGDGTPPPSTTFYFPVGLAVSPGGNVLYAVNSDFDLQWNGGTLQSYDLNQIRQDAVITIADPNDPRLHNVRPGGAVGTLPSCSSNAPVYKTDGSGRRQTLGETCAPPVDSTAYVRDSAIIGAFATDLQRSNCGSAECTGERLFVPVRGDASLTWADVVTDVALVQPLVGCDVSHPCTAPADCYRGACGTVPAPPPGAKTPYAPFTIGCGTRVNNRCDATHHAGSDPSEPGNTRGVSMPGEPFGLAQSEDGETITITHQNDTKTSLFFTGMSSTRPPTRPSLQFILDGLPIGGNGITAVPHDPGAFDDPSKAPRPAFLQTSRAATELNLLRYYSDQASGDVTSTLHRPFLMKELSYPLTVNAGGADSRGIVIDHTPRIACKLNVKAVDPLSKPPRTQADVDADKKVCARLPARVFFANRSPASMLTGEIGESSASGDSTYDADRLLVYGNVPLSFGPSKLYLAPVVTADGTYALRVFIVCFDAAAIFIYDPDAGVVENIIRVSSGPFAMAFDPFDIEKVAAHAKVDDDPRAPGTGLKKYRFAYVASFTNSFVQAIDLDNSLPRKDTFEKIVFTLGLPTLPKGSR